MTTTAVESKNGGISFIKMALKLDSRNATDKKSEFWCAVGQYQKLITRAIYKNCGLSPTYPLSGLLTWCVFPSTMKGSSAMSAFSRLQLYP